MEIENNVYVIKVKMEKRPPEDIAKDATHQIVALFNHLVEEQKAKDVK